VSDFLTSSQRRIRDLATKQAPEPSVEEQVTELEQRVDRIEAAVAPTPEET